MIAVTVKDIRKVLGGFLFGLGVMNFVCFLVLDKMWRANASRVPDPAHGLIYGQNEHGTTVYFSNFHSWAVTLLPAFSIPLAFVGYFVAPKTWERKLNGITWKWVSKTEDDAVTLYGLIAGFISLPLLIYFAGPILVSWAMNLSSLL